MDHKTKDTDLANAGTSTSISPVSSSISRRSCRQSPLQGSHLPQSHSWRESCGSSVHCPLSSPHRFRASCLSSFFSLFLSLSTQRHTLLAVFSLHRPQNIGLHSALKLTLLAKDLPVLCKDILLPLITIQLLPDTGVPMIASWLPKSSCFPLSCC